MKVFHAITGQLEISLMDNSGTIVERRTANNSITPEGRVLLARLFCGQSRIEKIKVRVAENKEELFNSASVNEIELHNPSIETRDIDGTRWAVIKIQAVFPKLVSTANAQNITAAGLVLKEFNKDQEVLYNQVTFPTITRTSQLDMTLGWEIKF
ncbi:hypothetical protein [Thiolinea disciformis]|uniref:hypothetical protein n=1 Tax=Thiolinea disciformis TaxID=125614 RepID=UPI000362E09E|nr:hypothetical protein [Thiolinea disciformis]